MQSNYPEKVWQLKTKRIEKWKSYETWGLWPCTWIAVIKKTKKSKEDIIWVIWHYTSPDSFYDTQESLQKYRKIETPWDYKVYICGWLDTTEVEREKIVNTLQEMGFTDFEIQRSNVILTSQEMIYNLFVSSDWSVEIQSYAIDVVDKDDLHL